MKRRGVIAVPSGPQAPVSINAPVAVSRSTHNTLRLSSPPELLLVYRVCWRCFSVLSGRRQSLYDRCTDCRVRTAPTKRVRLQAKRIKWPGRENGTSSCRHTLRDFGSPASTDTIDRGFGFGSWRHPRRQRLFLPFISLAFAHPQSLLNAPHTPLTTPSCECCSVLFTLGLRSYPQQLTTGALR